MRRLSRLAARLMLCIALPAYAAPPDAIQASYDIYQNGMKLGRMDEIYTREQDRYTLTSTTTPLGLLALFKPGKVVVSSSGMVGKQGLQPLRFSHQRERDPSKDSQAEFDWDNGRLTQIHQEQRNVVELPPGTQDRLSAMYQFMFLSPSATAVDFPMTNGIRLNDYHYAVSHGQQLDTPAGRFDTLYLDDQAKPGERHTEIWLAVQRNYLPCKMVITEADGEQLIQILSSLVVKP